MIEVDGQEQVIGVMFKDIVGVDPEDGELLWAYPHKTELGQSMLREKLPIGDFGSCGI